MRELIVGRGYREPPKRRFRSAPVGHDLPVSARVGKPERHKCAPIIVASA